MSGAPCRSRLPRSGARERSNSSAASPSLCAASHVLPKPVFWEANPTQVVDFSGTCGSRTPICTCGTTRCRPGSRHFGLVRYDRRGYGQSSVPKGPYPMERLGRDVLAVIDALGIGKMNWCGLSMGRHGRTVARRQCPGPHRQAYIVEHLIVFRRQNAVGGPALDRARQRLGGNRRCQYGALVHQRIP